MFASFVFAPTFFDTDRMTPPVGGRGGTPRLWFTVAFVALFTLWLIARVNGYWR